MNQPEDSILTGWNLLEDGLRHKVLKALCIEGRPVYRYGILKLTTEVI